MMTAATHWTVPREYFDPLYNYLVHGFEPGSFWTGVLANDFFRAISSSHPNNDIPTLKNVVGWIRDQFPAESYGNYSVVKSWLELDPLTRRLHLEQQHLIYTEKEEIMMGLRGDRTYEPLM
jgi:hypothetical protein